MARDPLREYLSEYCSAHIRNPGFWDFVDLFTIRQVGLNVGMLRDEAGDIG